MLSCLVLLFLLYLCTMNLKKTCLSVILWSLALTLFAGEYSYHFKPIQKDFDQIAERLNKADFENVRQDINPVWLDQLDSIARLNKNKQLEARAIYWRVRTTQMSAQPSECIPLLQKALKMTDTEKYDYDAACIHYQLAGNYDRTGQYFKCYTEAKEAIAIFEKYEDYYFLGNAHLLLAQLFHEISSIDEAKTELELANENYMKAGYPLNRIYFYEALFGSSDKAVPLYKKSIEMGGKDWGMTLQALINLSERLQDRGHANEAEYYINQGFQLIEQKAPDSVFFRYPYPL